MIRRSSLFVVVALASCSNNPNPPSGQDLAMSGDGGGGCLASTPATSLYEDMCAAGRCYYDHPPMDGF
jgi:hypothetical protein